MLHPFTKILALNFSLLLPVISSLLSPIITRRYMQRLIKVKKRRAFIFILFVLNLYDVFKETLHRR